MARIIHLDNGPRDKARLKVSSLHFWHSPRFVALQKLGIVPSRTSLRFHSGSSGLPFSKVTTRFCLGSRQLSKIRRRPWCTRYLLSIVCNWNANCGTPWPGAISKRNQMLRITRSANGGVHFRVSGELDGENVAE